MFKLLDYTLKSGPFEFSFSHLIITHFPFECFDSNGLGISKSMMTALLWWAWSRCTNISIKTVYKLVQEKGRMEEEGVLYVRGNCCIRNQRFPVARQCSEEITVNFGGPFFLKVLPREGTQILSVVCSVPLFCCPLLLLRVSSLTVTASADS